MISNRAAEILATRFANASGEEFIAAGLEADDYMQQSSAIAAGAIKSVRAVPALIKMTASSWPNNRRYAITALGDIGNQQALPALEALLVDADIRIRRLAAEALRRIDGQPRHADLAEPSAAEMPPLPEGQLAVPGGRRPPQFICLGVDDCANVEGLEAILDIVETLADKQCKVVFTLWVAPLAGDWQSRDTVKQELLYQRLFDLGREIGHHTLHHNPGGRRWASLPREIQVEEIDGCTAWYREHIDGFTRPFTHKGGGGGAGAPLDREFTRALLARQGLLYWGRGGQHPNEQRWPQDAQAVPLTLETGVLDAAAPPVHAVITDGITSDYPGRFDYDMAAGLAMWKSNFDFHYAHPRRPILAVNAFHDWGLKSLDDSTAKYSHRNEAALLKQFLLDVLVENRERYPETHVVTFRQVVEYVRIGGNLEQALAIANGQDRRNPAKPSIE